MRIAVVGSGYVGLVSGACLAEVGHRVTCVDNNQDKVERLQQGLVDIYEPGLPETAARNLRTGNLTFSADLAHTLLEVDAVFIAVGTPLNHNGCADMSQVYDVATTIGETIQNPLLVICKSTSPVGTCDEVSQIIKNTMLSRKVSIHYDVVSNPEFLKEGSAVKDFMRPDRIIIGSENPESIAMMRDIYAPFNRHHERIITMSARSSELTKYAANAMLATKISFINEMANIAERVGADIEDIRHGIGSDPRIGYDFIYAGCGYGGSCFPKDVAALTATAKQHDYNPMLISSVEAVNHQQKNLMAERISQHFNHNLQGRQIAVWGLAFKPNTDDIREAPSLVTLKKLLAAGTHITAYDPAAMANVAALFTEHANFHLADNKDDALAGAEALMIFTEWKDFKVLDYNRVKERMADPVIFDGRNLFDPARLRREGFTYFAIGRGDSINQPLHSQQTVKPNSRPSDEPTLRVVK